jgi:hypothetical protein
VFGSILFTTGGMLLFTVIGIPLGIPLFAAGLGLMLTPKARSKRREARTPGPSRRCAVNGCRCRRSARSSRPTIRRSFGGHLELHRERLEERLAKQRALLASLERALTGGDPRMRLAAAPDLGPSSGREGEPGRAAARSACSWERHGLGV